LVKNMKIEPQVTIASGKGDHSDAELWATYLLLHPVVFINGVLIFGRGYPEEGRHPLAQVVAGCNIRINNRISDSSSWSREPREE